MISNNFIAQRYEIPIFTLATFNFRFLTDWSDPLIPANGLVSAFTRFLAFKALGKNILPASEQGPKQGDLFFLGSIFGGG